jgi:hypothetical protein
VKTSARLRGTDKFVMCMMFSSSRCHHDTFGVIMTLSAPHKQTKFESKRLCSPLVFVCNVESTGQWNRWRTYVASTQSGTRDQTVLSPVTLNQNG